MRKEQAELDGLKAKAAAETKKQPEASDAEPAIIPSGTQRNPVLAAQLGEVG